MLFTITILSEFIFLDEAEFYKVILKFKLMMNWRSKVK